MRLTEDGCALLDTLHNEKSLPYSRLTYCGIWAVNSLERNLVVIYRPQDGEERWTVGQIEGEA